MVVFFPENVRKSIPSPNRSQEVPKPQKGAQRSPNVTKSDPKLMILVATSHQNGPGVLLFQMTYKQGNDWTKNASIPLFGKTLWGDICRQSRIAACCWHGGGSSRSELDIYIYIYMNCSKHLVDRISLKITVPTEPLRVSYGFPTELRPFDRKAKVDAKGEALKAPFRRRFWLQSSK